MYGLRLLPVKGRYVEEKERESEREKIGGEKEVLYVRNNRRIAD